MFLQRVTCNKTHTTFFEKTTWVLVCNSLLMVTKASYHNSTIDYIHNPVDSIIVKTLIETVKSYFFLVIDSDIEQCSCGLKYKHNNEIFKEILIYFLSSFKGHSNKRKKNLWSNKCKKATLSKNLLNKKINIIKVNVNKQSKYRSNHSKVHKYRLLEIKKNIYHRRLQYLIWKKVLACQGAYWQ